MPIASARLRKTRRARRGATVVLFAVMLVMVLGFMALAVDLGYVCSVKGDLQAAADAGALAGTGVLLEGDDAAITTAQKYVSSNMNNRGTSSGKKNHADVEVGHWNSKSRIFVAGGEPRDAVRVVAVAEESPLFFGRAVGRDLFISRAGAVAAFRPRDIMLVLDVSGSMREARGGIRKIDELRQATSSFLGYLNGVRGHDRVGFVYYSSTAQLGANLTTDLDSLEIKIRGRLIPSGWTNVADGMMLALEELESRRAYANPMIVLLTDGAANTIQPGDLRDVPEAKRRVIEQAQVARQRDIPIFTMALDSLTSEVDVELMKQVSEITDSESYHVIAGEIDENGQRQLKEAFRRVAYNRAIRLVD